MKLHEILMLCSISPYDLYRKDSIIELLNKQYINLGTEEIC